MPLDMPFCSIIMVTFWEYMPFPHPFDYIASIISFQDHHKLHGFTYTQRFIVSKLWGPEVWKLVLHSLIISLATKEMFHASLKNFSDSWEMLPSLFWRQILISVSITSLTTFLNLHVSNKILAVLCHLSQTKIISLHIW